MVPVHAHAESSFAYTYQPVKYPGRRSSTPQRNFRLYPWAKVLLTIAAITVVLLGYVALRIGIVTETYTVKRLEDQLISLRTQRDQLQLEASRLQSLDRIESVARGELGMSEPHDTSFVAMAPETSQPAVAKGTVLGRLLAWVQGLTGAKARAAQD